MNYAAEQILHVYRKAIKEEAEAVSSIHGIKVKAAYGSYYIDVKDVFEEHSTNEVLKFENVGYGGVNFLGNINGKVPSQGLYYKNQDLKFETERLIRKLHLIGESKRGAVEYISEQHGTPKPQHAVLSYMARS